MLWGGVLRRRESLLHDASLGLCLLGHPFIAASMSDLVTQSDGADDKDRSGRSEDWKTLHELGVLLRFSLSRCLLFSNCQHFRYEVGRHFFALLTFPIQQGLIP